MASRVYAPPRHRLVLTADDDRIHALAEKLWHEAPGDGTATGAPESRVLRIDVDVFDGPTPAGHPEKLLAWTVEDGSHRVTVEDALSARVDREAGRITARVASGLLETAPELVARVVLEACTAALFQREAFQVLHAGAVVGARGAAVIRGAAGAGKSTLVAAAWREGFPVLGDESLLVAREDLDELASSVRDLTVRLDSARLLGFDGLPAAYSGGEEKRRIDLFSTSTPAARTARRAATLLLGPRDPGPARLVALSGEELLAEFRRGEIPQERLPGDPDAVGLDWVSSRCFRLDGATDIEGSLRLLRVVAGSPAAARE